MIDLHPAAFPPGAAAMTSIAHIGVHLWRVDERRDDSDAIFDILIARSMAASFGRGRTHRRLNLAAA